LLELQVPPVAASASVVVVPTQIDDVPVIEPAFGSGFTVTGVVVKAVAHAVVTV
jgi:hypothetical protein